MSQTTLFISSKETIARITRALTDLLDPEQAKQADQVEQVNRLNRFKRLNLKGAVAIAFGNHTITILRDSQHLLTHERTLFPAQVPPTEQSSRRLSRSGDNDHAKSPTLPTYLSQEDSDAILHYLDEGKEILSNRRNKTLFPSFPHAYLAIMEWDDFLESFLRNDQSAEHAKNESIHNFFDPSTPVSWTKVFDRKLEKMGVSSKTSVISTDEIFEAFVEENRAQKAESAWHKEKNNETSAKTAMGKNAQLFIGKNAQLFIGKNAQLFIHSLGFTNKDRITQLSEICEMAIILAYHQLKAGVSPRVVALEMEDYITGQTYLFPEINDASINCRADFFTKMDSDAGLYYQWDRESLLADGSAVYLTAEVQIDGYILKKNRLVSFGYPMDAELAEVYQQALAGYTEWTKILKGFIGNSRRSIDALQSLLEEKKLHGNEWGASECHLSSSLFASIPIKITQGVPKGVLKGVSKGIPKGIPKRVPQGVDPSLSSDTLTDPSLDTQTDQTEQKEQKEQKPNTTPTTDSDNDENTHLSNHQKTQQAKESKPIKKAFDQKEILEFYSAFQGLELFTLSIPLPFLHYGSVRLPYHAENKENAQKTRGATFTGADNRDAAPPTPSLTLDFLIDFSNKKRIKHDTITILNTDHHQLLNFF